MCVVCVVCVRACVRVMYIYTTRPPANETVNDIDIDEGGDKVEAQAEGVVRLT